MGLHQRIYRPIFSDKINRKANNIDVYNTEKAYNGRRGTSFKHGLDKKRVQ